MLNLAWQLFVCEQISEHCLVLIDEPENHLHPKLQRTLFPKLVKAFPTFQFVAATHSPVILGSVQDANIYALKFNDDGLVESHMLDRLKSPATADDILQEVLGMEVLEPEWVMTKIMDLVQEYEKKDLTEDNLEELRGKMKELFIENRYPKVVYTLDKLKR